MFSVNYQPKVLHVAINNLMNSEDGSYAGVIYHAQSVFDKVNTMAERLYEEFFQPDSSCKLICINTEMGPGELMKVFGKQFGAEGCISIGGTIAPFTIPSLKCTAF
jgi:hypothetical protein